LAEAADAFLIAPVTANTIAKLAMGIADNLLSITALAVRCPLLLAPAMDVGMFEHPATQENIKTMEARGVTILGPTEGRMASGLIGRGRMIEPAEIIGELRKVLGREGSLSGKKVVVTAGGTSEPMDPVRSLTNRSSGKQGYALAQAAIDLGAEVQLISTPTSLVVPIGVEITRVNTAAEMADRVLNALEDVDALIMAAAVADFRPAGSAKQKIKRGGDLPALVLEPTEDILQEVRSIKKKSGRPTVVVGFAAESEDLLANAQEKLKKKDLTFIVANDISTADAGFNVETNRVVILTREADPVELPLMSKSLVAEKIMAKVAEILGEEAS
jgi:phosphopantothenoylcysteine decarboxylase/phosphopantothenate--cysteine ligase